MSGISRKLLGTTPAATGGQIDISEYFSTYLYTGNDSTQTITNGIDLAGEGGLVWIKGRSSAKNNALYDTERGVNQYLYSNSTLASTSGTNMVTAFNSDGFSIGSNALVNEGPVTYASWTFRKAPRFFDVVTWTGDGVAGREIAHNLGVAPGCIIVKRTSAAEKWAVYHRSTTASPEQVYLQLHLTSAYSTSSRMWNDTLPSDAVFTVGDEDMVNASGFTYVAYLFAHDPLGPSEDGSDGLIACGSYTGNGSTVANPVTLGWEPQWLLIKQTNASGNNWILFDVMRGIATGGDDNYLYPNTSGAEGTVDRLSVTPTGFSLNSLGSDTNASGSTYIYIAIRRGPMRAPESGTEVYSAGVVQNNTGRTLTNPLGYPSDMAFTQTSAGGDWVWQSRLTGTGGLFSNKTNAESTVYGYGFDNNTNYEADGTAAIGAYGWNFRRAPGFFDVVAYTGDGVAGRTVPHNLGVAPELIIAKSRTVTSTFWRTLVCGVGLDQVFNLNTNGAKLSSGNGSYFFGDGTLSGDAIQPTASEFYVSNEINQSGQGIISYLFATLPGVSKVGSYTGNGSSQTINCGFTTGARFVLIKRTDSTGDWYVWDTARGIVTGNDPFLELNTTDAEVTSDDSIDPDSSGFIVNQTATTNVNVSSASYIFLAIA